jgi:hypothetical protein
MEVFLELNAQDNKCVHVLSGLMKDNAKVRNIS